MVVCHLLFWNTTGSFQLLCLRLWDLGTILRLPLGFITGTIELIHSVCSFNSVIMPSLDSLFNSSLYAVCMATGTDLGGVVPACTVPSV